MEIRKVESAGFCFGVDRAVKKAFEIASDSEEKKIYTLGKLIHNESVIGKLKEKNIFAADTAEEIPEGSTVIIRAHGVKPEVIRQLESKKCVIYDETCPFVKKIHNLVADMYSKGYRIIIAGDRNHPEVIGINGWCGDSAAIISDENECESYIKNVLTEEEKRTCKFALVFQTTFNTEKSKNISEIIKKILQNCEIFDTICRTTLNRQTQTREIAADVDLMIVIGSKYSSNTVKLFEISKELCKNVVFAEDETEIDAGMLKNFKRVGVTAGASTPDWIISKVIGVMSEVNENDSFEELLEESLKTLSSGEKVTATVIKIDESRVYVDLGFKFEGYIPNEEFAAVPGQAPVLPQIGDAISALVVKVNEKECEVLLSKRRLDNEKNLTLIEESFANKTKIPVVITELVKGKDGKGVSGVNAFIGTSKLFIPASHISDKYESDFSSYIGKTVEVVIITFERDQRARGKFRIIGSVKEALAPEKKEKEDAFWNGLAVDQEYDGTVRAVFSHGAYVDFGGLIDGYINSSEIAWRPVRNAATVLKKGDSIKVRILSFDRNGGKRGTGDIILSAKFPDDDPWKDAEDIYHVGDILEVTVARFFKDKGVFVSITDDIDGFVHISEISNRHINNAAECLKIGQIVQAKIIKTDIPARKISLSIRDVQAYDPEPKPEELDEEGNPVEAPKKERKPRREKTEKQPREKKAKKNAEEEVIVDKDLTSSASSIGDILGEAFNLDDNQ